MSFSSIVSPISNLSQALWRSLTLLLFTLLILFPSNLKAGAVDDNYSISYGTTLNGNVLTNDTGINKEVTAYLGDLTCGHLTMQSNGDFTYTPGTCTGTVTFHYRMKYGYAFFTTYDTAKVTIIINTPPDAVDDSATTDEDTAVTVRVLDNDSDPDGDAIRVSSISSGSHGSVSLKSDGTITYTPYADYYGDDRFTYYISDGTDTDSAVVTVTVNPVNDAPDAQDDSASTDEDENVTINVLSNDSDVDGDALSITAVSNPSNGNAVIDNNQIIYTPDPDYSGDDSFTYTVSDGTLTATATVTVTVNPVNDAPVAQDDSASTDEDSGGVEIGVTNNDSDIDGWIDQNSITVVSGPSHGSASPKNDGSGKVTYTPDPDFYGTDSFTYTVKDNDGATSNEANVTITVNPVNDAPDAVDDDADTEQETTVNIPVLANDSDVDGDPLTLTAVSDPAHGSVSINGNTIDYTPEGGFFGTDSFEYNVSDGNLTATATVTVDVARICHGCDCALDDNSRNSVEPGITIPDLNGTTTSVSTCLSGTTSQAEEALGIKNDIYNFTVGIDGEFNITTDSPNDHEFYLEIKINGTIVYPNTKSKSHSFIALLEDGDEVILRFSETGDDLDEYQAHMSFSLPDFTCSHPHQFITRFNEYIPGDLVAIGNSNICADIDPNDKLNRGDGICDADQRQRNDLANIIHVNKYSSTDSNISSLPDDQAKKLLNVTNAVLDLPPGAKVKWAGLYWQGEVWNFKKGVITNTYGNDSGVDGEKMMAKELKVSFMRPNDTDFMTLKADELYWFNLYRKQLWGRVDGRRVKGKTWGYGYGPDFGYSDEHYFYYFNIMRYEHHYQGFKDVTALLQEVEAQKGSANGRYWVGNIQATVGLLGFPGVEAAWTLQVVYELPSAQPRVITVTDGYVGLYSSASQGDDYVTDVNTTLNASCKHGAENTGVYAYDVSFDIDNILTPKKDDFSTDMTVFATESDPDSSCATDSLPEQLTLTRKDGSTYVVDGNPSWLPGADPRETCDAWHYSITKKDGSDNLDRHPDDIYPIGMTLRNYHMTDALSAEQNSTHITFKTDTDRLIIGVIGFATDLRAPQLCYDYDLRVGEYYKIEVDQNRSFEVDRFDDQPLQVKLLIRNQEADFDFENATLHVVFTPDPNQNDGNLSYQTNNSMISPEGTFTYLPVDDINSSRGEIPIGTEIGPDGGLLDAAGGSTYVKQFFDLVGTRFKGKFDIYVEGDVTYISEDGPIHYKLSTAIPEGEEGYIPRCPRNPVYDPIYGYFNVEVNGTDPTRDSELKRYSLPTQISGRPFAVQVVAYAKDASGSFNTPTEANTTVEVEIIDISAFDNNSSAGYDVSCEEPSSVGRGGFIELTDTVTEPFEVGSGGDYNLSGDLNLALRNAAFRVWVLTIDDDSNLSTERVIFNYHRSDYGSYNEIYQTFYQNKDDKITEKCDSICTSGSSDECYSCLRTYAGEPYCSRDNFSIRPAFFAQKLYDDGNATAINESTISASALSTNQNSSATPLIAGYAYPITMEARNYGDTNPASHYSGYFSTAYSDRNATLTFALAPGACADESNSTLDPFLFYESVTIQNNSNYVKLVGPNAGRYSLQLVDSSWTLVDQATYPYQTKFDDGNGNTVTHEDCNLTDLTYTGPATSGKQPGCWISSNVKDDGSGRGDYYDMNLSFYPDRFDLSSISIDTQPVSGESWLYMNDLAAADSAGTIDVTMAMAIHGTVIARGADDNTLSNYTAGCFAQQGTLRMEYTSQPATVQTADTQSAVPFLQYLYDGNTPSVLSQPGADGNISLPSFFFPDDQNGTAPFDLYSNLQRPGDHMVNVSQISYAQILYRAPDANASGYGVNDHIPEGIKNLDRNVTFYYATVAPDRDPDTNLHFYRILNLDKWQGPLKVRIYCEDDNVTNCAMGTDYDPTDSESDPAQNGSWYLMSAHGGSHGDITSLNIGGGTNGGTAATLTPAGSTLSFSGGISATDAVVTYPLGQSRPYQVDINISADPWLLYGPDKSFSVYFDREKLRWRGKGKTGRVIQTDPSTTDSKRINW